MLLYLYHGKHQNIVIIISKIEICVRTRIVTDNPQGKFIRTILSRIIITASRSRSRVNRYPVSPWVVGSGKFAETRSRRGTGMPCPFHRIFLEHRDARKKVCTQLAEREIRLSHTTAIHQKPADFVRGFAVSRIGWITLFRFKSLLKTVYCRDVHARVITIRFIYGVSIRGDLTRFFFYYYFFFTRKFPNISQYHIKTCTCV